MSRPTTVTTSEADAAPCGRPARSVVVPVYDEPAAGVERAVDGLLDAVVDEVVLAPDDPEGELAATVDRLGERERVTVVASDERRGKGGALVDGLDAATGETIGYVDADGAVCPADLARLYATVEGTGAADGSADAPAVAAGSRAPADGPTAIGAGGDVDRSGRTGQPASRRLLGRAYGWLARRTTGVPVRDPQCGAKVLDRGAWAAIEPPAATGFAFDTELLARLDARGFDIAAVPIDWADPGDSAVRPVRDAPRMLAELARIRGRVRSAASDDGPMRLALVSSHPPNRGHLAEYGEELATAYAGRDDVEPVVLARRDGNVPGDAPAADTAAADVGPAADRQYEVRRVWSRDDPRSALGLWRELVGGDYDAVQFNVHMTYFGRANHNRFLGLALPALTRAAGVPTITTLHDLLEVLEEDVREETVGPVERVGARVATQVALLGHATTVTSEAFRDTVEERYLPGRVAHVPHGTFLRADGGSDGLDGRFRVLVFGHLGPTKDVRTVVRAFERVRNAVPGAELVIAGGSHPDYEGYRESLTAEFGDNPGVRFTGYVPEDELPGLWGSASVVVMPYTTCTGVSGVYQLAKSYGRPAVVYDTESMHTATVETGGDAAFVPPGEPTALADRLVALADDRERLRDLAAANAAAGREQTMADTADSFVDLLDEVGA